MESIFSNEDLMIIGYWILVFLVMSFCIGIASAWTTYKERHR